MQFTHHLVLSELFLANLKWHGLLKSLFDNQTVCNKGFVFPQEIQQVCCAFRFSKILSILEKRNRFVVWHFQFRILFMNGNYFGCLKIVGNMLVEKYKLHIVARCVDISSWTRCKFLVGILLGPQDLIMLRDITLRISSFVAVIMKEPLIFVYKKLLRICLKT